MIKSKRSQDLIDFAILYATEAHKGQLRKLTDTPYIEHPIEVAIEVSKVTDDVNMICAALLHDVLEDCEVTYTDLINAGFSFQIAELVKGLTNLRSGKNRRERKRGDRERLRNCDWQVQTIKMFDIMHNAKTMYLDPTKFGLKWYIESYALAYVMDKALPEIREQCLDLLESKIDSIRRVL